MIMKAKLKGLDGIITGLRQPQIPHYSLIFVRAFDLLMACPFYDQIISLWYERIIKFSISADIHKGS